MLIRTSLEQSGISDSATALVIMVVDSHCTTDSGRQGSLGVVDGVLGILKLLLSYHMGIQPLFGKSVITHDTAVSDCNIHRRVVWGTHETNWRCELLALNAVMTGSNEWTKLLRWMRESLVSQVWGPGTSGLDVVPPVDEADLPMFCWVAPPEEGWESCRPYLSAFVEVLSRWPGCPRELRGGYRKVFNSGEDQFSCTLEAAIMFYIHTFVSKFDRLSVPPVCASLSSIV